MASPLHVTRTSDELRIRLPGSSLERVPARDLFLTVLFGAALAGAIAAHPQTSVPARAGVLFFGLAFAWALNRASRRERIHIGRQQLEIRYVHFFHDETHRFQLRSIRNFRFVATEEEGIDTDAPQRLAHGASAGFRYRGRELRFGAGLHSWDVDALEALVADFTGYDIRYNGSGEYGATGKPPEIPLLGQWAGTYTLGEHYGPQLAGTQCRFRLYIDSIDETGFSGRCLDLEGVYAHLEPALLRGYADDGRVEFEKQYAYTTAINATGQTFIDRTRAQAPVLYRGQYNASTGILSGDWEIANVHEIGPTWQRERISRGTWEARKDD